MAFDNQGDLTPERLDEWFDRWDKEGKGGLTFAQGWRGVRGMRMVWDAFGQVSAFFECESSFIWVSCLAWYAGFLPWRQCGQIEVTMSLSGRSLLLCTAAYSTYIGDSSKTLKTLVA